jgi:hypothetical protein
VSASRYLEQSIGIFTPVSESTDEEVMALRQRLPDTGDLTMRHLRSRSDVCFHKILETPEVRKSWQPACDCRRRPYRISPAYLRVLCRVLIAGGCSPEETL